MYDTIAVDCDYVAFVYTNMCLRASAHMRPLHQSSMSHRILL